MGFVAVNREMNQVLRDTHNHYARALMDTLKDCANAHGIFYHSIATLEKLSGLGKNTVVKYLKLLRDTGWIAVYEAASRNPFSGRLTTTSYQVSPHYLQLFGAAAEQAHRLWIQINAGVDRLPDLAPQYTPPLHDASALEECPDTPETTVPIPSAVGSNNNNPVEQPKSNNPTKRQETTTTRATAPETEKPVTAFDPLSPRETPQVAPTKSKKPKPTPDPAKATHSVAPPKDGQDAQNITKVTERKYPEVAPVANPLSEADERLAARIRDECQIAIKTARGLVRMYRPWQIEYALKLDFVLEGGPANRKGGRLRHILNNLGDQPADNGQPPTADPYFVRESAPWIER